MSHLPSTLPAKPTRRPARAAKSPGGSGQQSFRSPGQQKIFPELDLWVASNACVGREVRQGATV